MIINHTNVRVQYCDTDQMGFAHHSNYVKYFEQARMDLLRNIGIPYNSIEEAGFIMPVIDVKIHYHKPAFFDDDLDIETRFPSLKGPRILFMYKINNQEGRLICEGETTLAFAGKESRRACHPPAFFLEIVNSAEIPV